MSSGGLPLDLTNHFLIAMPGLEGGIFHRSVVYVCEHSAAGALGIVVNKPSELSMAELFEMVALPMPREDLADCSVLRGGPVQTERGFVLHNSVHTDVDEMNQVVYASSLSLSGGIELTTSKDVLESLSTSSGPS